MKRRKLGATGIEVSEISFGAWQTGNKKDWAAMDDKTAHALVEEAIDRGVNLFDTAPNYGGGRSEALLGEILQGRRQQVVLVSKFGHKPDGTQDFSVEAFRKSLEGSMARLKTDYLDVLLVHNPPARMYDGDDPVWGALEAARQQGKIRFYGASLDFAAEIEACLNNTGSTVVEILFNIFHQDARRAFPLVRRKKTGVIVKVPLDSGWLTGRFNTKSSFNGVRQRWSKGEISRRAGLVAALDWLTADGSSLAHKALSYPLSYQEVSCVIPGMRTRGQLLDNLAAAGCTLTLGERERLERFWNEFTNAGKSLLPW